MPDDANRTAAAPHPTTASPDDGIPTWPASSTDGSATPQTVGPYELLEELARGGMGVVYRARDPRLSRDVAVKLMHESHRTSPAAVRRFTDEATIAGQLQHPGVAPVFEIGHLPDGSLFLAMKLIKGDTLDALLKACPDPSADRGRHVATFEKVCEAVGYAHAHGVIHRDLKPANVMVGAFGEVQVMDWGLAKVLGAGRAATDDPDATLGTEIRSTRGATEATQAGSLLGTPAYMPPEQAIGAVDQVDRRSDVFGLGAILCAILTGQPPFVGADSESTRQLAARAKLDDAFARLDASGAEPEFVALAKRCLSAEKADRPADGGVVAAEVATLRAAADDRARRAELDRVQAAAEAREQRKRRRVVVSVGGALVAVLVLGVIGTAAGLIETRRQEAAVREERDEKDRALQAEAEQKARAEAASRHALKAADLLAGQMGTSLQGLTGTRPRTVVAALDKARTVYDELLAGPNPPTEAVAGKARLLTEAAELYRQSRRTGMAKTAAEEAIALYDQLAAAATDAAAKNRYRIGKADARHALAYTLQTQGYKSEAIAEYRRSIAEYEAAGGADVPEIAAGNMASGHTLIGNNLVDHGDHEGARAAYDAGLALRRAALARQPKSLSLQGQLQVSLERIALLAVAAGDNAEAVRLLREARRIAEARVAADPTSARYADSLLRVLNSLAQNTSDQAELAECVTVSTDLRRRHPETDPDNRQRFRTQLLAEFVRSGAMPSNASDLASQRGSVKTQLDVLAKLRQEVAGYVRDDPDDYESLTDVANLDSRSAALHLKLAALGDDPDARRTKARALCEASVIAYRTTLARDPEDVEKWQGLVYAQSQYANSETEAKAAYARHFEYQTTELDFYLRLVARYPRTAKWQVELRQALSTVALPYVERQSAWPDAAKDARTAAQLVALARRLADRAPGVDDETWSSAERARTRIATYLADVDEAGQLPADARTLRGRYPDPGPRAVKADPAGKSAKAAPFDPSGTWRTFAPPGGRFRLSWPGVPTRKESTTKTGDHTLVLVTYSLGEADDLNRPGVAVLTTDYPLPLFEQMRKNIPGVLDGAVNGMMGTGKLLTREEIAFGPGKWPGRECTWRSADGKLKMRARVVLIDSRMLILLGLGSDEFIESEAVKRVFNSFEVLSLEVAPAPRPARPHP